MRDRTLSWDGCLNVRDLGGVATENGGETAWGRVVRADSVRMLTDAGWKALAAHGIRTVVDLRTHAEIAEDPPHEAAVEVVHISVMAEPGDPVLAEIDAASRAAGEREYEVFYLESLRHWGGRFAESIAAVADAPAGGVAIHCHSGKDRTGLIAAFLLRLAGVSAEQAAADYALSAKNLAPRWRAWVNEAEDEEERGLRVRMAQTPAHAMLGVLETLEREHSSVAGFLQAQGLDDQTIDRARARLR